MSGDFGIGKTYDGVEFYFDIEDYDKIKDYNWFVNDQNYLLARVNIGNSRVNLIRMHRLVMMIDDSGIEIDHIHGKTSRHDNRKANLRVANHSQNNINKGIRKNNSSGYTGVGYNKSLNKWRARISVDCKNIELGLFNSMEEAVCKRKEAELKYHKEWRYDYSINI